MDKNELWKTALAKIELDLSRPSFLTWFQETAIADVENGIAILYVPNGFAKEWLQNKYHKSILHALRDLSPDIKGINYVIGKADSATQLHIPSKDGSIKKRRPFSPLAGDEDLMSIKELSINSETNLNPRYTFANFVVGSFNELAHAAAQAVLKNPGTACNPLFIYGGVGLGKTHLIQAIGNEILKQSPQCKVRYVPAERYMVEIVEAIKNQDMNRIKEKYRSVDLLIMDDIQFIARTEKMQEEFFLTFNVLFEKNKQVIISSDRPPRAIAALEERLRSRFEGGVMSDIGIPDFETRLLILRTKTDEKKVTIPEAVLVYIAENIKTNIRELEGALNRLILNSRVSNSPLDVETAKKIVFNQAALPKKFITAKKIMKAVAELYEIDERALVHRSRKKDIVKPRQIAMYLMREELKNSYPSIGDKFGGRDHTTVIHSCEKIGKELQLNSELEEEIKAIKEKIYSA